LFSLCIASRYASLESLAKGESIELDRGFSSREDCVSTEEKRLRKSTLVELLAKRSLCPPSDEP